MRVYRNLAACVAALTLLATTAFGQRNNGISDSSFIAQAGMAGMAEVSLGQLAAQQAASPQVREFASRMVQEHSMQNEQLMGIGSQLGIMPPAGIDAKHAAIMDRLSAMSGPAFDAEFMRVMVQDHRKAIALFERGASGARSAAVRDFARASLPALRDHLRHAQSVQASVGDVARGGMMHHNMGHGGMASMGMGHGLTYAASYNSCAPVVYQQPACW